MQVQEAVGRIGETRLAPERANQKPAQEEYE
jgi:hypothetical protein